MGTIKNICSLIPLLSIYAWTMVLGYWSPELPTESQSKRTATWYQLDGRTDGSLHVVPTKYSDGELSVDAGDPGTPFHPASIAWTKSLSQPLDVAPLSKSILHLHDLYKQDQIDLLYPFHFFF
ncbi:MAG: hypothetical protein H2058_11720 [Muricauda sp.]|nr:hypothetical protein [Allomuricauda sp.]MBA4745913.1 hypothetical protein [Allomuricauda sp.]